MGIRRVLNAYKSKWRFARTERKWNRSERKREIDAERDLPPRPLTPEEDELLRWILEHGSEEARSFLPQIEGIRATRSCTCGCPSICLVVAEEVPLGSSRADKLVCELLGRTAKGELVGVMLFQIARKLCELEVYSLDEIQNETPEFGLPVKETLEKFEAGQPPAPSHL